MTTREEFREYLMERVIIDSNDCWLWQAHQMGDGYGSTKTFLEGNNAHRNSYRVFNGTIPKRLIVRHTCDVRLCINPDHLKIGTHQDNVQDCIDRERRAPPNYNGRPHEISDKIILEIRSMAERGMSYGNIAATFNISKGYAWKIVKGWYR